MIPAARCFALALAVVAGGSMVGGSAIAQDDAMGRIKKRAEFLRDFRNLFAKGADPSMADAAFEEGVRGKDETLRKIAIKSALGSGDARMQAKAVRYLLMNTGRFIVLPVLPDAPTDAQKFLARTHSGMTLVVTYDPVKDTFTGKTPKPTTGQLAPGGFNYVYSFGSGRREMVCTMRMRVANSDTMTGETVCTLGSNDASEQGKKNGTLTLKIELG